MAQDRDVWILAEDLNNIGDFALLTQAANLLRRTPGIGRIAVRQWNPSSSRVTEQLKRVGLPVIRGKSLRTLLPGRRLLIYGGGQAVRGNASTLSMVALSLMTLASRLSRGRRAAIGIGLSHVEEPGKRALWRLTLSSFSLLSCRDRASVSRLKELGSFAEPVLTDDLAFLPSQLHDDLARPLLPEHVLIAPCHDPGEGRLLDLESVRRITGHVAARFPGAKLTILAHDPRPEMDLAVAKELAACMDPSVDNVRIAAANDLESTVRCYRACQAVVTNRLHAMVFGMLAGKPVFVVDDGNSKLAVFAERFGVPVLPQSPMEDDALAGAVAAGFSEETLRARAVELDRARQGAARNQELLRAVV